MEYKQHPYFTHEQVKETVKSNYLEKIKGKDDGEVLLYLLDELACLTACITSQTTQIQELKQENRDRKKESEEIGKEQQKIHKWYREQFKKIQGWRWWR